MTGTRFETHLILTGDGCDGLGTWPTSTASPARATVVPGLIPSKQCFGGRAPHLRLLVITPTPRAGGPPLRRGYRDLTVTTEDDTLPAPSVASALRVWVPVVFGTVQVQV